MEELLFEKRSDGVALITLNRPDSLNALTDTMFEALGEALAECARDRAVRCVALTGAGRAFCSGGDVKGMAAMASRGAGSTGSPAGMVDRSAAQLRGFQNAVSLPLHTMAKPTVAIVNGVAAGAGFSIALACDVRLCSDRARFGTAFRNVGLSGDFGASFFLPRIVGSGRARELFFTAEIVDAQRALELGIANRVYEHDSLMEEALAFCAGLAAGPTAAMARMKENLNLAESGTLQAVLDQEAFYQRYGRLSSDHREGARAFAEKREPRFTGE
ncbi:MAG TPA: enoyl-CoA hydratase [Dehalococcoidia bacterium]|nr:enoyl-CoA hydratase [Dehalococcoidia bacterium]